ncbi:acetolactate synthase small subunit [Orbus hercynius]|uniref:acetolactate synthase n=1 Tax=Orbus hercynius TaxID=593135 RepID=A0A495RCD2_9GAMM|nr:acetolactate synthase small subunit [Orbus hercynius]RKS85123.1 acetolactate synthase small subunit [Orbus hercynius]
MTNTNIMLTLTVLNHPGVMTHICGLFARRAFNVDGILCLPINASQYSRIWLLVKDDERLEQMVRQIEKLEDVHEITINDHCQLFEQLKMLQNS